MRWHAACGQAGTILVAALAMHLPLPVPALLGCVGALAVSNVALVFTARRYPDAATVLIAAALSFDIVLLTIELVLSGGASNPFAAFYLVHVLLAGLLLSGRWVIRITLLAVASYADLVAMPTPVPIAYDAHRSLGTWIAFAFLAFVTAMFTWRTSTALRASHADLLRRQRMAAHAEKLASLSTLAAGAAHELGSPLGTIAVASEELGALILEAPHEAIEDARVIREEVARCREIVHRMNARAGQLLGELPERTTTGAILDDLREQSSTQDRARLIVRGDLGATLECPPRGLVRVLGNLVANALHASAAAGGQVVVTARSMDDRIRFLVDDRGHGIPAEVRARLGEPFVTSKDPDEGMGLGLFLSFAFAELCAGQLQLVPRSGGGTSAVLELPRAIEVPS